MPQKKEPTLLERIKTYPYLRPMLLASVILFLINILASIAFNILNGTTITLELMYSQFLFLIFLESGLGLCLGGIIMVGTFEDSEQRKQKEQIQEKMRTAESDKERSQLTISYLKLREQKNIRVGSFLVLFGFWIILIVSLLDILLRFITNI